MIGIKSEAQDTEGHLFVGAERCPGQRLAPVVPHLLTDGANVIGQNPQNCKDRFGPAVRLAVLLTGNGLRQPDADNLGDLI